MKTKLGRVKTRDLFNWLRGLELSDAARQAALGIAGCGVRNWIPVSEYLTSEPDCGVALIELLGAGLLAAKGSGESLTMRLAPQGLAAFGAFLEERKAAEPARLEPAVATPLLAGCSRGTPWAR